MSEKRFAAIYVMPMLVSLFLMSGISSFWMRAYRQASFVHVSGFCRTILEDAPELETQLLSSLKKYSADGGQESAAEGFLLQYGYDGSEFTKDTALSAYGLLAAAACATVCAFFVSGLCLYRGGRRRIDGLTAYLERVNAGADKTLVQTGEDLFSRLQDEMYKTVTALYQTREAAVKAKERFAENLANIAHQLKTPITAASLSLQMLERAGLHDGGANRDGGGKNPHFAAQAEKYAGQIKRQLMRLQGLEEALLTLSRIDAGMLHLERTGVDAYTVLNLAADNLEELLKKKEVSVSILEGGTAEFCGDMEWTMEALLNLMKNCLEHSERGKTIRCSYSQNPLYTQILIQDEGTGFAQEDLPHLFERFYRGKGAIGNGIGIGLSLARSIMELQNGTVTAGNLPEGGACFEVRIYA